MTGATWTDTTRVKDMIASGTPITDAKINDVVDMTESYYYAKLKIPSDFTFNANTKIHLILRQAATLRAALSILSSQVSLSHRTIEDVYLNYNGLFTQLRDVDIALEEVAKTFQNNGTNYD